MITRKWVARWFNSRNNTIGGMQAVYRGYVSNKALKPKLALEWISTIQIQRICRGRFGRIKADRIKYGMAAERIQASWRGVVARAKSDKKWLNRVVVPIQTMVRGKLARHILVDLRVEYNAAALMLQKRFRCYVAKQRVGNMLRNREVEYRIDSIALLTNDEEWVQEKIEKMIRRLLRRDFQGMAENNLKKMLDGFQEIYDTENDLAEMNRQKEILSPRAISQGYYQEMNTNCISLRERCTKEKTKQLFQTSSRYWESDALVASNMHEIEEVAAARAKLGHYRDTENAERGEREMEREQLYRKRMSRQSVAEERRRWQVHYYTPDGKPDKKRKPGCVWAADVYAGQDKDTYSAANVDIFAEMPDSNTSKPGSEESIKQTVDCMSLQTYLQEVNAYEQILQPITDIMQVCKRISDSDISSSFNFSSVSVQFQFRFKFRF